MQHEPATKHAGQRKERHIDADELGEFPLNNIDQQGVSRKNGAATKNPEQTAAAQAAPDGGVSGHFQTSGGDKNKPGKDIHRVSNVEAPAAERPNADPCGVEFHGGMLRAWGWKGDLKGAAKALKVHQTEGRRMEDFGGAAPLGMAGMSETMRSEIFLLRHGNG
jgi:hypothetical protein